MIRTDRSEEDRPAAARSTVESSARTIMRHHYENALRILRGHRGVLQSLTAEQRRELSRDSDAPDVVGRRED